MRRQEAKKLLPLIKAFSEGKIIQIQDYNGWKDIDTPRFNSPSEYYRIKPELKYKPFTDVEKVYESVKKHGNWVKHKNSGNYHLITNICDNEIHFGHYSDYSFKDVLVHYVWADDESPIGVEEV